MKYFYFFISLFCTVQSYAQNSVNSMGMKISGTGGTINYSVGQITYSDIQNTTGSASQGIQQPYKITAISNVRNDLNQIDLAVFPNPTSDMLNLKIDGLGFEDISYQLLNIEGMLLESGTINKNNTSIKMNERVSSIYLLKLINDSRVVKTFRIVKY